MIAMVAEHVLYDFAQHGASTEMPDADADALVKRFPNTASSCDVRPGVTMVTGAFTRRGASETAALIDYCPTAKGSRRLVVLDGQTVTFDQVLPASLHGEEVVLATDVTGDGLAELLLLDNTFVSREPHRQVIHASLVALRHGKAKLLGRWVGHDACTPSVKDVETLHTIFVVDGPRPRFRDQAVTRHCAYEPAAP